MWQSGSERGLGLGTQVRHASVASSAERASAPGGTE